MKKSILTFILFLFAVALIAQVPTGFSYQAVVRNNSGEVVANKTVKFRFTILQNNATGTSVYVETQSKLTNEFGLANLVVGTGTKVSGNFDPSAWGSHSHFLKVELDPNNGNAFSHLGTMQLMAVPYAFHAQTVEEISDNSVTSAKIADGTIATADLASNAVTAAKIATNAVAEAKIASGAVTGAKIAQAGATTGQALKWNGTTWAPAADETGSGGSNPTGPAGGDLTGTFPNPTIDDGKVTSAKIASNAVTEAKIANGAVTAPKLASMGATAGQVLTYSGTAWAPQTVASGTSQWLQTGSDIYFNAGKVGIGKIPGADLRQFQVLTGDNQAMAAVNNSSGYAAIFAQNNGSGPAADFRNRIRIVDGTQGAGKVLTSDATGFTSWNTPNTGPWQESGGSRIYYNDGNVGIGVSSPIYPLEINGGTHSYIKFFNNSTGTGSTDGFVIGTTPSGGSPVWIWNYENSNMHFGTNNQNRMIIKADGQVDLMGRININSDVSNGQALFVNGKEALWFNGTCFSWGYASTWNYFARKMRIGGSASEPGYMLYVDGTAAKSSAGTAWIVSSDERLKDIKGNYSKGLDEIMQLRPVVFSYKENNPRELPSGKEEVGFVSQEVQKVFPEAVNTAQDGYLDFDIHSINVALVNAIKELKAENDRLNSENREQNFRIERLERFFSASAQHEE